jgi:hypothetical protein
MDNKCLEVLGSQTAAATPVVVNACNGGDNQMVRKFFIIF